MGNAIRFSGLSSGLDTESIVKALMTNYQSKIDKINKNSTLDQWKKDAYKEMSTKIQNFRTNAVSKLKYTSGLNKSEVSYSQEGIIKVDTSKYTEDGVHSIEVNQIAKNATVNTELIKARDTTKLTKSSQLTDIGTIDGASSLAINGKTFNLSGKSIDDLQKEISSTLEDVSFKFDEKIGAFIINTTETGADKKIDFTGTDDSVLQSLGIKLPADGSKTYEGQDAKITYNGSITFTSATNKDIEVNGITFTATAETTAPITVTVSKDINAMVDIVKNFVTEYNSLISEINTKLNADSAKGYEPLTDEQKEAMSDSEIEKWEEKIKGAILRKDSTLSGLDSMLRGVMMADYSSEGLDSKCSMLSQLGISTTNWTDKGKLTLDEEKLKKALTENGDGAVELLTKIANKIDKELTERSSTTELRSYGQFFSDKILTSQISQYAKDLITAQNKYDKMETAYYKKFTAMETAMNNLNSQSSLFSSL